MTESILEEAQRLVSGARQDQYGPPVQHYERYAGAFNALFAHKLREELTAADMALVMGLGKLVREAWKHTRDNLTDCAGYAWVAQDIHETAPCDAGE